MIIERCYNNDKIKEIMQLYCIEGEQRIKGFYANQINHLERMLSHYDTWIAVKDGVVVGMCSLMGLMIEFIWTHPKHRGGAIAGLLVRRIMKEHNGVLHIFCDLDGYERIVHKINHKIAGYFVTITGGRG